MKAKEIFFVTGGTGFIGGYILRQLHKLNFKTYTLVRDIHDPKIPKHKNLIPIKGDITKPKLGISDKDFDKIKNEVTTFIHAAALYNTSAPEKELKKTNLRGTINVLDFCKKAKKLKSFNYLSTLYVSGAYEGKFPENKLPRVRKFHNPYEKSKYEAERRVLTFRKSKRIFRLPMVVGEQKTGKTAKFDGIYKLISLLNRGKFYFYPGDCHGPVNVIPVDFATKFILQVILSNKFKNKIFNMVGPEKINYKKFINYSLKILGGVKPYFIFPEPLWSQIVKISWRIPIFNLKSLNLFNQKITYENKNYLKACKSLRISHPNLLKYLAKVITYYKNYAQN